MAQYSYTYFDDGTQISAASINAAFEAVRNAINDLTVASLLPGTFNENHVDSIVSAGGATFPLQVEGDDGLHTYTRSVFGTSIVYSAYGANGGTETASSYTGDRLIIGHPDHGGAYSGPLCKISLSTGIKLDGSSTGYAHCMLVSLDVEIADFAHEQCEVAMFCVQALVGGTWYTVTNSERFITFIDKIIPSGTEDYEYPVSIRALITPGTLTDDFGVAADATIDGIRGMLSLVNPVNSDVLTLNRWNLSILPLWAKVN